MKTLSILVLILSSLLSTQFVHAQEGNAGSSFLNRGAQYHLGDKDQILMNVNVWGYVAKPGQYVVPRNTDLITLISFAGGPREGADLSQVSIVRGGLLTSGAYASKDVANKNGAVSQNDTLAVADENSSVPILTVDVKDHLESGEIGRIPILYAGDTVIIGESSGSKFSKFLGFNSVVSIITAMASVAIIVERL